MSTRSDWDKSKSVLIDELEEARMELKQPPEWGNCRRGCPPAFLDRDGYCSPACALGAPRGEFVTLAQPITKTAPQVADWDADRGDGFNSRGYEAGRGIYHDPMG